MQLDNMPQKTRTSQYDRPLRRRFHPLIRSFDKPSPIFVRGPHAIDIFWVHKVVMFRVKNPLSTERNMPQPHFLLGTGLHGSDSSNALKGTGTYQLIVIMQIWMEY